MTERKPTGVSFESWVEKQIREAQENGQFDNLPGAGKPLPGVGKPHNEMSWIADFVKREQVDGSALLPPSLALPKELEDLPRRLAAERSEAKVREIVLDLNERIRAEHRKPQNGPAMRAAPVDVDEVVATWREARAGG